MGHRSREGEVDPLVGLIRRALSPQIDRSYSFLELCNLKISPSLLPFTVIGVVGVRRRDDGTGGHDVVVDGRW